MTTTYAQQIQVLRDIQKRQNMELLKAVANDYVTTKRADFEKACLSDVIAHLEMVAGCEGCADTFPFQSK